VKTPKMLMMRAWIMDDGARERKKKVIDPLFDYGS